VSNRRTATYSSARGGPTGGRQPYPLLTFACQAHDHRGNPLPRPKGPRGHRPPSPRLSSNGEERINGERDDPTLRAAAPRRFSRQPRPCQAIGGKASSGHGWGERRLYHLLTSSCQAHDHGGNPPPRPKGLRGHPPPSRRLSSEGEEKVNGERRGPTHRPPVTWLACCRSDQYQVTSGKASLRHRRIRRDRRPPAFRPTATARPLLSSVRLISRSRRCRSMARLRRTSAPRRTAEGRVFPGSTAYVGSLP
jgi:hypothetical protein